MRTFQQRKADEIEAEKQVADWIIVVFGSAIITAVLIGVL